MAIMILSLRVMRVFKPALNLRSTQLENIVQVPFELEDVNVSSVENFFHDPVFEPAPFPEQDQLLLLDYLCTG